MAKEYTKQELEFMTVEELRIVHDQLQQSRGRTTPKPTLTTGQQLPSLVRGGEHRNGNGDEEEHQDCVDLVVLDENGETLEPCWNYNSTQSCEEILTCYDCYRNNHIVFDQLCTPYFGGWFLQDVLVCYLSNLHDTIYDDLKESGEYYGLWETIDLAETFDWHFVFPFSVVCPCWVCWECTITFDSTCSGGGTPEAFILMWDGYCVESAGCYKYNWSDCVWDGAADTDCECECVDMKTGGIASSPNIGDCGQWFSDWDGNCEKMCKAACQDASTDGVGSNAPCEYCESDSECIEAGYDGGICSGDNPTPCTYQSDCPDEDSHCIRCAGKDSVSSWTVIPAVDGYGELVVGMDYLSFDDTIIYNDDGSENIPASRLESIQVLGGPLTWVLPENEEINMVFRIKNGQGNFIYKQMMAEGDINYIVCEDDLVGGSAEDTYITLAIRFELEMAVDSEGKPYVNEVLGPFLYPINYYNPLFGFLEETGGYTGFQDFIFYFPGGNIEEYVDEEELAGLEDSALNHIHEILGEEILSGDSFNTGTGDGRTHGPWSEFNLLFKNYILSESDYCPPLGDTNNDGTWNILDIVVLANCILAQNCDELWGQGGDWGCAGDINQDGAFNVLDIVILANCVLGQCCSEDVDCPWE